MANDYRNTKYCPNLDGLAAKKEAIKDAVLKAHPRAKDMHTYISNNEMSFKRQFVQAYNGKCAYCGVSVDIISLRLFEIDHLVPKESARFGGSKAKAGQIENLVAACSYCNRNKSGFECTDEDLSKINPDTTEILESFFRDNMYYIKISNRRKNDDIVRAFYEKVGLGCQAHRIDYLLMNMRGVCDKMVSNKNSLGLLREAIDLLQRKRNKMW